MTVKTGRSREIIGMQPPVYQVDTPMGKLWFPADEYGRAYQHATGERIEEAIEHEEEHRITIVEFDGPAFVPVASI